MPVPISTAIQNTIAQDYIAILGRNPEPIGFRFWTSKLANNNGTTAANTAIVNGFSNSPEFISIYGSLTTAQAVNTMYQNILGRAADATGSSYWQSIANGFIKGGATIAEAYAQTAFSLITSAVNNTGTTDSTKITTATTTAVAFGTSTPITAVSLTTGIDTLSIGSNTRITGSVGPVAANPSQTTLNAGDDIVGSGTGNTLRIVDSNVAGGLSPLAEMKTPATRPGSTSN